MRHRHFYRILEIWLVSHAISFYVLAASLVSLNRYWQHNAFWYDFGILDTTIWKLSRLELPRIINLNPPTGKIVWADHFNPSVAFLAPLYWVTDKQEVILLAQAVVVGLSAIVAYVITLKYVKHSAVRLSLVTSYLGFVGLQNALYTDIHNIVFALLPLMGVIWAIIEKRWMLYWLFLLITMGFQENMAAVAIMLGVFLIFRREKHITIGVWTIGVGILYALLAMKVIIPWFNGHYYAYQPAIPTEWHEWITRFFLPADMKLRSIMLTYATFGFLPLGTLSTVPLIVEHYLERFVLNTAATRWDLGFHYNALLSPLMFLASLEAITHIQRRNIWKKILPVWGATTILVVLFLHRFYLHGPLMLATHPVFYQQTKDAVFLDPFIAQIPDAGILMTQNNIAAHFTHGNTFLLHPEYERIRPDVIAVDLRPGQNANNFFPRTERMAQDMVASVSADPAYTKQMVTDTQFIFSLKASNAQ